MKKIENFRELNPALKEKRLFSKIVNGEIRIMKAELVHDVLEKRLGQGIKLEDLFMIVPAPMNQRTGAYEEGEQLVETKFGRLRTFFVAGLTRSYILHKSKYDYPKISLVKKVSASSPLISFTNDNKFPSSVN